MSHHHSCLLRETVRIADDPKPGRYDAHGKPNKEGNVFVQLLGPTAHVWAVFSRPLCSFEAAAMTFENIGGDGILDSIVSQWIDGGPGPFKNPFNVPYVGEANVVFLSRQRAPGVVRVAGRNASQSSVHVAAALLYIPGSGGG